MLYVWGAVGRSGVVRVSFSCYCVKSITNAVEFSESPIPLNRK